MRKIGIYLSVLVLLLASCKNDSEILRNMKPLEQYYKKYTVQQLVEKIMKDNGAKSVGIHFDLSRATSEFSGTCIFRASLIFNEGEKEGYGTLLDRCNEVEEQETTIKYTASGEVVSASGIDPYYFKKMTFLFETLDLKVGEYKVIETKYDAQRGEKRVYFELPLDFQKDLFQNNFNNLINKYIAEELVIMKYRDFNIVVGFLSQEQRYDYHEAISWENELSDEPRLNFEKEAGQKNE